MGVLINNKHVGCNFRGCGYGPIRGKESQRTLRNGDILLECRWTCPQCQRLVRRDDKTIKKDS